MLALIEKQGEVVTREEIRVRLWPADTHVNCDANVNTIVKKLRQALGDSFDQPLYIETLPRKGYALIVVLLSRSFQGFGTPSVFSQKTLQKAPLGNS